MTIIRNLGAGLLLGALSGGPALAGVALRLPAPAESSAIYGLVTDFDGAPLAGVSVSACGVLAHSDAGGRLVLSEGCGDEPEAIRRDGLLSTGPAYVTSSTSDTGDRVVHFVFDPRLTGGMGLSVVAIPAGIQVDKVLADTPADRAGLAPGDRILEVSEQLWIGGALRAESARDTQGLRPVEFARLATGPAGTPVSIVVQSPGAEPRDLTLIRSPLLSDTIKRF